MSHDPQFARDDEHDDFAPAYDPDPDPMYNDVPHIYAPHPAANRPLAFADAHMTQLGLTLDFGPHDLATNQDGTLTGAQIEQLEADFRWFYWPMIGFLALIAFLIGVSSALAGTLNAMPFVLLGLAAIPAVLLKMEREQLPDRPVKATTLRLGRLSKFTRRFDLMDERGPLGGVKYPVAGGKPIWGPHHLYKVLNANQTYIVYYAPARTWRGFRLLSIEPADPTIANPTHLPKRKGKGKRGGW